MKTNKIYTLYHDLTVRKLKYSILFTVHTKASYFSIFGKKYKSQKKQKKLQSSLKQIF